MSLIPIVIYYMFISFFPLILIGFLIYFSFSYSNPLYFIFIHFISFIINLFLFLFPYPFIPHFH